MNETKQKCEQGKSISKAKATAKSRKQKGAGLMSFLCVCVATQFALLRLWGGVDHPHLHPLHHTTP